MILILHSSQYGVLCVLAGTVHDLTLESPAAALYTSLSGFGLYLADLIFIYVDKNVSALSRSLTEEDEPKEANNRIDV